MELLNKVNQTGQNQMETEKKQFFTCIGKGHGSPCLPATREDWEKMRREPWLAEMCARIEKGQEELKHRLPVWTPSCAEFRENHRAAADAIRPLNRLMMDFDEKGHTDEIMARLLGVEVESLRSSGSEVKIPENLITIKPHGLTVLLIEESTRLSS